MMTTDDERIIVLPNFRLRFRRVGDRWTHALSIQGRSWVTFAKALEWDQPADDPTKVVSPVFQELHSQGESELLLVGQAGPHYFSASVQASYRIRDGFNPHGAQGCWASSVFSFDIAQRCSIAVDFVECNYATYCRKPVLYDCTKEESWSDIGILWECDLPNDYGIFLEGTEGADPSTVVAISDDLEYGSRVRIAPKHLVPQGTNRIRYEWSHTQVFTEDGMNWEQRPRKHNS
jgi:hypothetical protein